VSARSNWRERAGRRFARFATTTVVDHPWLWRLFRGPLRAQFDRLAPVWEGRRAGDALAALERALDLVPSATRALDLGTGTGKGARLIAVRYPQAAIVGVDLSPRMVDEARSVLPVALADRVHFTVADASELPFPDGSFDLLVLLNMIPFFDELARVAAPGARVVFVSSSGSGTPIYVSPETLRAELSSRGFEEFETVAEGGGTAVVAGRRGSA